MNLGKKGQNNSAARMNMRVGGARASGTGRRRERALFSVEIRRQIAKAHAEFFARRGMALPDAGGAKGGL